MSCIPQDTEKIVGHWTIVDGKRAKDKNWLLIERCIAEESRLIARDAHAYMEVAEKRFWRLSYADSAEKRAKLPTLVRLFPKTDDQREKGRVFNLKVLARWQNQYLRYLADSSSEPDWPQWQTVFAKLISEMDPLREFWKQNKSNFDSAFNALIEEIINEGPRASGDR